LENRIVIEGFEVTAYVCENYTCKIPATEMGRFMDQLLEK